MPENEVIIEKLVFGGQGLGTLADGRKVFVWNALPGERVRVRIIKKKKSYVEAIAEEVLEPSAERVAPSEGNYLATSPWQMMTYAAENTYKQSIVQELFDRDKVVVPEFMFKAPDSQWNYRNKMEYSFWGDDDGLHLALHMRGSHGKQIVTGSRLALPAVDKSARAVCEQLNTLNARAGDLKTIIVRADQQGNAVASLFTKLTKFKELELPEGLQGLRVYHSNPKSPASVPTELLYELGDVTLSDELLGQPFVYDVDSFFQVNIPIFEQALTAIREQVSEPAVIDMYSGVGGIGLSVATDELTLVELDPASERMAAYNLGVIAPERGITTGTSILASAEASLEQINDPAKVVIFDPPRAGLHPKVVTRVLEIQPAKLVYLSCNPSTQARDLALLQNDYDITFFEAYNFFPRTPHIETLAVLTRKPA